MLVTILEIVAFMVAAAVLGLLLGWVLRGMFGNEQAEISDVRAQLRKLKRAQRELEAAAVVKDAAVKQEKVTPAEVVSVASKQDTKATPEKTKASNTGEPATEKPKAKKSQAKKPQAKKKASAKKASGSAAKKGSAPRKTVTEREADQATARLAFAEVTERIGQSDGQDKLTKIYGVGKRYEEMLNELGLSSYAQLAKLRKAEVKTLAGALGILDARVETEDWVGSAKTLAKGAKTSG